jgi:hypothetical protein
MSYSHLATGMSYSPLATLAFISLFLQKESADSLWTHPRKYCLFKLLGISMHGLWEVLVACSNLAKKKGKRWNILDWKCGEPMNRTNGELYQQLWAKLYSVSSPRPSGVWDFEGRYPAIGLKLLEWSSQINDLLGTWVMATKPLEQYYDSKSHFSRP